MEWTWVGDYKYRKSTWLKYVMRWSVMVDVRFKYNALLCGDHQLLCCESSNKIGGIMARRENLRERSWIRDSSKTWRVLSSFRSVHLLYWRRLPRPPPWYALLWFLSSYWERLQTANRTSQFIFNPIFLGPHLTEQTFEWSVAGTSWIAFRGSKLHITRDGECIVLYSGIIPSQTQTRLNPHYRWCNADHLNDGDKDHINIFSGIIEGK